MVERINWDNTGAVIKACEVLKKGGVLVYPTDTLYGFGCDAKNEQAIHTINTIKNRSGPMSVIAPSKDAVETWLKLPGSGKMDVLKNLAVLPRLSYRLRKILYQKIFLEIIKLWEYVFQITHFARNSHKIILTP